MNRRTRAISLQDAAHESPTLARLWALAGESQQHLDAIATLLPPALRDAVRPGPIDGADWCLVVDNNAVLAKLRQMVPALCAHLRAQGRNVTSIRLKVRKSG